MIKSFFLLFLMGFVLLSCDTKEPASTLPAITPATAYDLSTWVKADLVCEELRNADENDPQAVVYLTQLEVRHVIDTIYTCSVIAPQMYISYDIPRDALSACGGWWAGRGNFYYAMQEGDSIAVMHANPVQGDTLGFEYNLMKYIPISSPQD